MIFNKINTVLLFLLFSVFAQAQEKYMVDKIVAVVGSNAILQSDIEQQVLQYKAQKINPDLCQVFENFLLQKLLVNQAKVDSVEVNDAEVEGQLESRIKYFISQAGSQEKLEEYYNRSIFQIREDMRRPLKEQMIMQRMQREIAGDIKITPSEVSEYYASLHSDSIPMVNAQIEYRQIVVNPPFAEQTVFAIKDKLLGLRKRILDGEKFATLAYLYSEDPGSAKNGGEIGFLGKGELDPEYAKAAFNLRPNAVSNIVESQFGYHIIQLIEKQADRVNTRHILLRPRPGEKEIKTALNKLDSILTKLRQDSLTMDKAAFYYSDDKNTRLNGGLVVNPYTNSTKFELDQLSPEDYYILKNLNVGDYSEPFPAKDEGKKDVYKIVKLVSKIETHKANLSQDYLLIQEMAIEAKRKRIIDEWAKEKIKSTYIKIDPGFSGCDYSLQWVK